MASVQMLHRAEEARLAAVARMQQLVAHPDKRIAEIMATRPKKWIGAHVSASGGVERAAVIAASVGEPFSTLHVFPWGIIVLEHCF